MRSSYSLLTFVLTLLVSSSIAIQIQEPAVKTKSNVQLVHMPDTPHCFLGASEQGDPGKEGSIMKMKGSSGCTVPWHWHPAAENIMMVSGTARAQVKHQKPVLLEAGSFLSVPSKHVMSFACIRDCTLFVYTDGPFAIHYVDDSGKEIPPTAALKNHK